MSSQQTMAEARRWLYKLETRRDAERIWSAFDDWFEASEEHRAAYAEARRQWLELTGAPPERIRRIRSHRIPLPGPVRGQDADDFLKWCVLLAGFAAILCLTAAQTNALLPLLSILRQ